MIITFTIETQHTPSHDGTILLTVGLGESDPHIGDLWSMSQITAFITFLGGLDKYFV